MFSREELQEEDNGAFPEQINGQRETRVEMLKPGLCVPDRYVVVFSIIELTDPWNRVFVGDG